MTVQSVQLHDARPPASLRESAQRRRHILAVLLGAVFVTFALALALAQARVWGTQVITDLIFVAYLAHLIHLRNVSAGTEMSAHALGG